MALTTNQAIDAAGRIAVELHRLIVKYGDTITGRLLFDVDDEFFCRHHGSDATYTSELGWRNNKGEELIVAKMDFRGAKVFRNKKKLNDELVLRLMGWMPAAKAFVVSKSTRNAQMSSSTSDGE